MKERYFRRENRIHKCIMLKNIGFSNKDKEIGVTRAVFLGVRYTYPWGCITTFQVF
jgi:hypothetical protein